MKTAKALGLDVPTSILLSADELMNRNTATQEDWIAGAGNGSNPDFLLGGRTSASAECRHWSHSPSGNKDHTVERQP